MRPPSLCALVAHCQKRLRPDAFDDYEGAANGLQVENSGAVTKIAAAVDAAIAANPQAIDELKRGKKKPEAVKGFLRGQVMKQTGGKANPALVGELLEAKLAESLQ